MHTTSKPKKRLEMMPEVLPAPTRQTGSPSVRARTMGHMHKMLAAAGAVASCTRPVSQPDNSITIPAPSATTTPSTAPTPSAIAIPTPTPTPVPIPPIPATPSSGYMVVDMLPSPARCYGAASSTTASAVWKQDSTGLYVELVLTIKGTNMFAPGGPSVWGGAVMSTSAGSSRIAINVRPNPGNTSFGASIDVSCSGQSGAVIATVQLGGSKKVGDKPAVTVIDR